MHSEYSSEAHLKFGEQFTISLQISPLIWSWKPRVFDSKSHNKGKEDITLESANMDMEVAVFLVVFLLTSSVATVAICCLELKAVWVSYRDTKTTLFNDTSEPECTCRLGHVEAAEANNIHGKYTRRESLGPSSRAASVTNSPKYISRSSNESSMKLNWSQQDNGTIYASRHHDNGLEVNNVRDSYRAMGRVHSNKSPGPVPIWARSFRSLSLLVVYERRMEGS